MDNVRRCSQCGIIKSITEYYNHSKNGVIIPHSECKVCTLKMNQEIRRYNSQTNTDSKIAEIEETGFHKICSGCKRNLSINEFNIRRSTKDGHDIYCKECNAKTKQIKFHNHKQLPESEYKQWRLSENAKHKIEKQRTKYDVFSHYCKDGIVQCANPFGVHTEIVTDLDVLTLDHINGDGHKEPKDRRGGIMLYRKLKQENYPDGFQILCANCQFKKKVINNEYGEFSGKVKPLIK